MCLLKMPSVGVPNLPGNWAAVLKNYLCYAAQLLCPGIVQLPTNRTAIKVGIRMITRFSSD